MLIGIWDTTNLLLFGVHAHDDLRPLDLDRVREWSTQCLPAAGEIIRRAIPEERDLTMPGAGDVTTPVLRFGAADAYDVLLAMGTRPASGQSDTLTAWTILARLVQQCMATQQIYPTLREQNGTYFAQWHPLIGGRDETARLDRFAHALPAVCCALPETRDLEPIRLVESFLTGLTDAVVRRSVARDDFFARVHSRPAAIDVRWLSALLGASNRIEADPREMQQLYGDVHLWLMPITDAGQQVETKLGLHLREPSEDSTMWPVDFRLVSTDDATTVVTAADLWRQQGSPLTATGRMILERQEKVLSELRRGMQYFPSLERALATDRPSGIDLTPAEAFAFMRSWSHGMVEDGFDVELPDWAAPQDSELSLQLEIAPEDDDELLDLPRTANAGGGQPMTAGGRMGLDALVRFDWRIAIGQQEVTIAEFEQLLAQQSPLVRFKDKWVQIDLDAAKKAQETIARNKTGRLTLGEAFRAAYGLAGDNGVPVGGLSGADWIGQLLSQVPDPNMQSLAQPADFKGDLRPYQLRGLQWMAYLDRLGLGACLADDMGLGKTIQFIALLLMEREAPQALWPSQPDTTNGTAHAETNGHTNGVIAEEQNGHAPLPADPVIESLAPLRTTPAAARKAGPTLLFAPASVLGNWTRELDRFAPSLKVMSHHGPARLHGEAFVEAANAHDVVLTGYTLAHRDAVDFKQVMWHRIALDEAQKVKNASSAASVAIRSFPARRCVALTGTPIENHLSELWSIMEVLNPGLLGTPAQFRERFVLPVEKMNDQRRGQLLREMIRPFVLRRTKQDPEVAVNLPSKMEMRVFTSLTPEQAAMYERITSQMLAGVENASGIRRRGLILAGLTRLKQICDHPALITDDKTIDHRSGKCERLAEMLEEVLESGDAALVFTQYREMGNILEKLVRNKLGVEPLFLHGGVPVKDRDTMIQEFQRPGTPHRIFLLSLRAGGLGLNLTAANHVFHFDRWWNPAVEAQATDRAHRIGQNKVVQVHKFVSIGTVEERIDKLLTEKMALADNIVTSGDQWLTNMSTDDLRSYLSLSSSAVEESVADEDAAEFEAAQEAD